MATPPPPPKRPVLKKGVCVIKDGVITCNGFERADNERLERLFHPELHANQGVLHPRTQKKFANETKKIFSRPFFASQLHFYGIAFPKAATEAQLHSLLDKAIIAKQCLFVPPRIVRLLEELKLNYDKEVEAWEKAVESWETTWKQRQEEDWAQLETPSERAGYDLERFMEHYFLTDGQPDQAKKPEPLALDGFTDEEMIAKIHRRAAQVPGLEVANAGSGPDRTICIGWDRAAVCGIAGEIEKNARESQKKTVQDAWENAMQSHQRFVDGRSEQPAVFARSSSQSSAGQTLMMARGSFIVQCKTVTDKFPDLPNIGNLSLDISDSTANNGEFLRAAVELGVFQGTAVLSFSQAIIDWFVNYYDQIVHEATGRAPASDHNGGAKRKLDAQVDGERPSKQAKVDKAPPNRILLRMRGRQVTSGRVCTDTHHGYLDFVDNAWTRFRGVLDIPGVGRHVEVEGFRVAEQAAIDSPPWNQYWPGVVQHSGSCDSS